MSGGSPNGLALSRIDDSHDVSAKAQPETTDRRRRLSALVVVGADGRIQQLNPDFAELCQRTANACSGLPLAEVAWPELADVLREQIDCCRLRCERTPPHQSDSTPAAQRESSAERTVGCATITREIGSPVGRRMTVEIDASLLYGAAGSIDAVAVRVTEAAICGEPAPTAANSHQFREDRRVARTGTWSWSPRDGSTWWSNDLYQVFGVSPATFHPRYDTFFQCVQPDDRARVLNAVEGCVRTRTDIDHEFRIVRPNGEILWLHSLGHAVLDERGELLRFDGTDQDITASKELQLAVQESENRLAAMFHYAPGTAIQQFNREGIIEQWNRASEQMYGFSAEFARGKNLAELILSPDQREGFLETLRALNAENSAFGPTEFEFTRSDGSTVWCLSTLYLLPGQGADPRFVCMDVDITDRKQAEQALREREEQFRMLADALPDSVFVMDPSDPAFPIVYLNECAARMHGSTAEELVGQSITGLIDTPDSTRNAVERVERMLRGEVLDFETTHRRRDGSVFPIEVRARRIPWQGGYAILGIERDLSARKAAVSELRRSEERLRLALDAGQMAAFDWDLRDSRVFWSDTSVELFGEAPKYDPSELRRPYAYGAHPEDVDRLVEHVRECRRSGQRCEIEYRVVREATQTIWVSMQGQFVYDDGVATRMLGVVQNISSRKRLETQMRQASKMEAVGQLAGGIAHDFNNLLTIVLGYSDQLLAEMVETDPRYSSVGSIRDAARRAANLTRQLLAFSRQQPQLKQVVDLNQFIRQSVSIIRRLIPETISIMLDLSDDLCTVLADPAQLDQVLLNLAVNARDAMPNGGTLTISTSLPKSIAPQFLGDAPHRHVQLKVTDTGIGMSEQIRSRLFEPFFTTKEVGQGTGLGLAVVHGVVAQSEGTISVDSSPGAGTTFSIELPWVDGPSAAERPGSSDEIPIVATAATILVVEDQPLVRQFICHVLGREGYHVLEASNGLDALAIAEQYPDVIHVLMTDVVMPSLGGIELSQRMRAVRPDIGVMFMSGYDPKLAPVNGDEAPVGNWLSKPFTASRLLIRVREVLGQSPAAGQAAASTAQ